MQDKRENQKELNGWRNWGEPCPSTTCVAGCVWSILEAALVVGRWQDIEVTHLFTVT